jgi:GTPase
MKNYHISENDAEKAYLVGAKVRGSRPLLNVEDSLKELALLADTAGMDVVGHTSQVVPHIHPKTFVGTGKIQEIKESIEEIDANVIIFDDEMSPRHQREVEKIMGEDIKVLDRSALILDIFAQHASTREGALQVELAQYEYRLPRLTRQWTHLARQAGGSGSRSGVGLRGPGETQLEVDRREIGRKITRLKRDLEQVRRRRAQHRAQRVRTGTPVVACVGYTNAGKSTLLNALTGANRYTADQLFATLDPTTRRVDLPSGRKILLTDTVGFIQKLPTSLIAAFRATLEEITEADVLLHVVDISHPNVLQHIDAVEDTLAEIDVPAIPRLLVWNKIDLLANDLPKEFPPTEIEYVAQVQISAQDKIGLDSLLEEVEASLAAQLKTVKVLLPYKKGELISILFDVAQVEEHHHTAEGVVIKAQIPAFLYNQVKKYQTSG